MLFQVRKQDAPEQEHPYPCGLYQVQEQTASGIQGIGKTNQTTDIRRIERYAEVRGCYNKPAASENAALQDYQRKLTSPDSSPPADRRGCFVLKWSWFSPHQ